MTNPSAPAYDPRAVFTLICDEGRNPGSVDGIALQNMLQFMLIVQAEVPLVFILFFLFGLFVWFVCLFERVIGTSILIHIVARRLLSRTRSDSCRC